MNEMYEYEMKKDHARANADGYVYKHILVAEEILGRPLTDEECIHHIDFNKKNNSPDNLMVFRNNSDHISFHQGVACVKVNGVYQREINTGSNRCHKKACAHCGNDFYGSKRQKYCCVQCSHNAQRRVSRPSSDELIREIERTSVVATARKYGVSDSTVRKWLSHS